MPGLDYKNDVRVGTGAFAKSLSAAPGRFYDDSPGRELVTCPDCQRPADAALGGDHGGDCIDAKTLPTPKSALGVIRAAALVHARFSANDIRAEFENAGVKPTSRGPAFGQAVKRKWIEPDGSVRSLDPNTKRHPVQTYRSLIHPDAVKQAAAAAIAAGRR